MPSEQQLSDVRRGPAYLLFLLRRPAGLVGTRAFWRRASVALVATATLVGGALLVVGTAADAANPGVVPLGTAANYSVLGASTVTNTGLSILEGSVGLSPGPSITGFPPGVVIPPATIGPANDAAAQQAQVDLAVAYADAASRTVDSIVPSDLGTAGTLLAGVYGALGNGALTLSGTLTLDGNNDPASVFIIKTATTVTTMSNSQVVLINGAQECNVFWQVGTSATLGTNSEHAGNILAAASITVTTGAVVHGRALADGAAVTLDTNNFTEPTCAVTPPTTVEPTTVVPTTVVPTTVVPTTVVPTTVVPTTVVPTTVVPTTVVPTTVVPTTVVPTTVVPTTVVPTTVVPTTVVPTTVVPTTVVPTTVAPTTTAASTTVAPSTTAAIASTTTVALGTTTPVSPTTVSGRGSAPTTAGSTTSRDESGRVVGPPKTGDGSSSPGSRWRAIALFATVSTSGAVGFALRHRVRVRG